MLCIKTPKMRDSIWDRKSRALWITLKDRLHVASENLALAVLGLARLNIFICATCVISRALLKYKHAYANLMKCIRDHRAASINHVDKRGGGRGGSLFKEKRATTDKKFGIPPKNHEFRLSLILTWYNLYDNWNLKSRFFLIYLITEIATEIELMSFKLSWLKCFGGFI